MKKLELIPDWRKAYKFFSVQLALILIIVDVLQTHLPTLQSYLPEGWVKWISLAIILGRILQQTTKEPKDD